MNDKIEIHVAEDFIKTLGARYDYEGKYSGENFLKNHLRPKFIQAQDSNQKLFIYLDGVFGYPSSFVSGSFGKLSVEFGATPVIKIIELISTNKLRVEKIINEIKNPKQK